MKKIIKRAVPKMIGTYLNALSWVAPHRAGERLYKLFGTPRKGRLRPKDEEFLRGAQHKQYTYQNHIIHTYIWGKGAKIITLLHGWESNAARWRGFINELRKKNDYTIVAIDAPAHGQSGGTMFNVPLYANFLHTVAQHYPPNILMGHSIGGTTTIFYATHFDSPSVQYIVSLAAPSEMAEMSVEMKNILGVNDRTIAAFEAVILQKFNMRMQDFSTRRFAQSLSLLGLVIHDIEDTIVPYRNAEAIAGAWQNATLITTQGLGHAVNSKALITDTCQRLADVKIV
ncbi:MAG: alpha/beta fold hydrolase [Saprospiraceae bacterium]|nr:alpha/beta fold hydrolase [Saprospiraceae bacterium]MBP7680042.1 alpha/beta fold hydrolase [Saprospiraceae bacterium]